MPFAHDHPDFSALVERLASRSALSTGMIEKDYWVTHTLWSLHQTGLEIWFKGGTSLSKAYGIIERFSEDVDLRVEPGNAEVPKVKSWKSTNAGPIAQRRAYFESLETAITVPGARVVLEDGSIDKDARGAVYRVEYQGNYQGDLGPMRPYVMLEIGVARVTPFVLRPISSFVHDELARIGRLQEFNDNRPSDVRCVHPLVTLIEKLDAISRRFRRDPMEPVSFVRHYEDAARIIRVISTLPALDQTPAQLIDDMLREKQIRWRPDAADPAFNVRAAEPKALTDAYAALRAMFWGERTMLHDACAAIRAWIAGHVPDSGTNVETTP